MLSSFFFSALFATLAVAQTSTITYLVSGSPDYTAAFAGSVVSACPNTTVLAVVCTSSQGSQDGASCGANAPTSTITVGPSLFSATSKTWKPKMTGTVNTSCDFTGTTAAVCEDSVRLKGQGRKNKKRKSAYVQTTTLSEAEITAQPVAITAGVEKLNATGACKASGGVRVVAGLGAAGLLALVAVITM